MQVPRTVGLRRSLIEAHTLALHSEVQVPVPDGREPDDSTDWIVRLHSRIADRVRRRDGCNRACCDGLLGATNEHQRPHHGFGNGEAIATR